MKVYLIGSLRNECIPNIARSIRSIEGIDCFEDWYAAGPTADDSWKEYEQGRGRTYKEALAGHAATHVFSFDKHHIDSSDTVVLALPAGKSGHLEFGYAVGSGKHGFILLDGEDNGDRWDVMYKFATAVCHNEKEMLYELERLVKGEVSVP